MEDIIPIAGPQIEPIQIKIDEDYFFEKAKDYVKPKWINIKDVLPPKNTRVLCYYSDQFIGVMEYWYEEEGKLIFFGEDSIWDCVSHWLPLPNPPEINFGPGPED